MKLRPLTLAGYTTYRTTPPMLVLLGRHRVTIEGSFIALVLGAGFALDRLVGIVIAIVQQFAST